MLNIDSQQISKEKNLSALDQFRNNQSVTKSIIILILISGVIIFFTVMIAIPIQNNIGKLSIIWGTVITIILNIALILWAWCRPASFIYKGMKSRSKWLDLRIWATIFLLIQIVIYYVLR